MDCYILAFFVPSTLLLIGGSVVASHTLEFVPLPFTLRPFSVLSTVYQFLNVYFNYYIGCDKEAKEEERM